MAWSQICFHSDQLKMQTTIHMCLPENYSLSGSLSDRKVLWLLHGLSDSSSGWLRYTRIEKFAAEYGIVVVMPEVGRSFYMDDVLGQNYYSYLTKELPEYLGRIFGLSDKKENNFIAGLSMGGFGAMRMALDNPDRFFAVGSFSGVIDTRVYEQLFNKEDRIHEFPFLHERIKDYYANPYNPTYLLNKEKDKDLKIYLACGLQDSWVAATQLFKERADELGIKVNCTIEDGQHEWGFWNKHVEKFIKYCLKGE